jgi:signal transduction histidine kinase
VIWDFEGKVLRSSSAHAAADVPYPGARPEWAARPPAPGPPQIRKRGEFREACVNGPLWTRVLIGTSTRPTQTELRHLALLLTAIGAGVLVIGLVGGWLVSLRAVRPIRAITAVAHEISASNLSRRIPAAEVQSELGSLAVVLNEMFARLDAAFQQQVRFTADASHELRTPLSVIHTHVQLALSRERSADEYRKTIETCLRASSRMKDLVDSLLLLAGADAGRLTLNRQRADLRGVVESCIAMVGPLAEVKSVVIEANLRPAELTVDVSRITQVTTNLLTNAIRYNREGGRVTVSLEMNDTDAVLTSAIRGSGSRWRANRTSSSASTGSIRLGAARKAAVVWGWRSAKPSSRPRRDDCVPQRTRPGHYVRRPAATRLIARHRLTFAADTTFRPGGISPSVPSSCLKVHIDRIRGDGRSECGRDRHRELTRGVCNEEDPDVLVILAGLLAGAGAAYWRRAAVYRRCFARGRSAGGSGRLNQRHRHRGTGRGHRRRGAGRRSDPVVRHRRQRQNGGLRFAGRSGTVLARIDDALYTSQVTQAKAQVLSAKGGLKRAEADLEQANAKLYQAERNWERAKELGSSSALAATDYDNYKAATTWRRQAC